MLLDEGAQLIARIPGVRGSLQRLVDLLANLLAHRVGGGKSLIIAARIQRDRNVEQRLAILQGDVGAGVFSKAGALTGVAPPAAACESEGACARTVRHTQRNQQSKRGKRQERGENPVRFSGLLAVKLHRSGGKPLHQVYALAQGRVKPGLLRWVMRLSKPAVGFLLIADSKGAPYLARFSRDVGDQGAQPPFLMRCRQQTSKVRGIAHLAKNERDMGHLLVRGEARIKSWATHSCLDSMRC